ncbi:N-acetylmuramoyl-L-alanine amidase [Streptomyces cellulosae]|uniref:N-acetylmuramoyl-L-alanine amidase n=2 Tax=Streptomyces TaxID=1883 RepID=A0ABU3J0X1_9ACTN|nr:N-acetylmuramoyl-L-alanine amidase [Streptomyces sp. McG7]MBT2908318.1 N-acetylmuramoyl-L-alanine amidase [Streptomyces sp. McG8]MDQ0487514.1 N-acetylmuramoyl-L-alanine amidase [Streptomyces thermodiastaticus]MDT6968717.1 N-acetylmuramoyl-L-alanine amidase [Streptomyces thermocarboxydus]THC50681.1 N-acetylmuramoyl-L-alanine amidase [Streptomyces sp. Akac8]WSB41190.1 N-acetylmuramoyl-L-alanine amidase [Streptomyces cellulosae]
MVYTGPDFDPPPQRRSRRGPLTVALAALVCGGLLGWGVYAATGSTDDKGAEAGGSPSAAPRTPSPAASSPTGGSASPSAGDEESSPAPRTPSASAPAAAGPLKGKVVVIDPGHNPTNVKHTAEINRQVDVGTHRKECDTTGTSTNDGYAEAEFTLDVAHRMRAILRKQGATVKLTQDRDRPFGPCVDERARIGNAAKADAVVSIHADGSGAGNRGFHVILPGPVNAGEADTRAVVEPSRELGERIAGNFVRVTGTAPSNYIGDGTGLVTRKDLGGLNLSTVPKVFIECGNMRDSKDAALLTSGAWRQKAAQGISEGIVSFLRG